MAKMTIKKGDRVEVLAGKDKGRQGEVLRALPREQRVLVQGVNMVRRHTKPSMTHAGGIVDKEAPLHVSNVALIDPRDGMPTRIGFQTDEHGRKRRISRRSGESIDV